MKKHFLLYAALGFTLMSMVPAEVCDSELFVKGTEITMTSYKANGTVTSTGVNTITNVTRTATSVVAEGHIVSKDVSGKELGSADMKVRCEGGKLYMDLTRFAANRAFQKDPDVSLDFEGLDMEYPAVLTVGANLPDANLTMTMNKKGTAISTTKVRMYDRKVLAKQELKTPAGTFSCYKISYKMDINILMGTFSAPTQTRSSIEFFSQRLGTIRSESYKADQLESYSEMTKLKKP